MAAAFTIRMGAKKRHTLYLSAYGAIIPIATQLYDKRNYILGECKFRNELFDLGEYKKLKSKYPVQDNATFYYLFSLSGFTDAMISEHEKDDSIYLISLKDILQA